MRLHLTILLLLAIFLTSCANQGVIVRKDSSPLPFYESVGVDGSYTFFLRDTAGAVHRQIVTPEVFERYAVGEYFNDLQPGAPGRERSPDAKDMGPAVARARASQPTFRIAKTRKAKPSRQLASKSRKTKKAIAKQSEKKSIAKRTGKKSIAKRAVSHTPKLRTTPSPLLFAETSRTQPEFFVVTVSRVR